MRSGTWLLALPVLASCVDLQHATSSRSSVRGCVPSATVRSRSETRAAAAAGVRPFKRCFLPLLHAAREACLASSSRHETQAQTHGVSKHARG
ncbi:hypothetical protein FA09DRAFT_332447 [Tilletiopsis washingtonensis]|uniref:Secreted protein n=1 Tax=Tilletiopsis washingtonensis TaxID=58919 RepID=A0A316Z111_9BASI|nr:hypothetical protein FA09DRAFT_332447 [Tilletiopsis washingtonensis]PWN95026.1 hypothetical protein FA09DRAFT_332447 [Tilletiopsis washingtonensis]